MMITSPIRFLLQISANSWKSDFLNISPLYGHDMLNISQYNGDSLWEPNVAGKTTISWEKTGQTSIQSEDLP